MSPRLVPVSGDKLEWDAARRRYAYPRRGDGTGRSGRRMLAAAVALYAATAALCFAVVRPAGAGMAGGAAIVRHVQ